MGGNSGKYGAATWGAWRGSAGWCRGSRGTNSCKDSCEAKQRENTNHQKRLAPVDSIKYPIAHRAWNQRHSPWFEPFDAAWYRALLSLRHDWQMEPCMHYPMIVPCVRCHRILHRLSTGVRPACDLKLSPQCCRFRGRPCLARFGPCSVRIRCLGLYPQLPPQLQGPRSRPCIHFQQHFPFPSALRRFACEAQLYPQC